LFQDNHLFQLARTGRIYLPFERLEKHRAFIDRIIYPILVMLFALSTPLIAVILGLPVRIIFSIVRGAEMVLPEFSYLIGSFLPIFLLVWVWLKIFESRSLWTVGLERPWAKKYLRGLGIGLLIFLAITFIFLVTNQAIIESIPIQLRGLVPLAGALLLLVGWIVQGAAEEVLTRGLLLPVIGARWGAAAGILVSSLLFSLLHIGNQNVDVLAIVNLGLFGLFASLYALAEGGLWGVFAIHSIWNWTQGNLFGFPVSGNALIGGVLIDLVEVGPDWLTGGLFGPEGGLIVTAALTISSLLVLLIERRRQKIRSKLDLETADQV